MAAVAAVQDSLQAGQAVDPAELAKALLSLSSTKQFAEATRFMGMVREVGDTMSDAAVAVRLMKDACYTGDKGAASAFLAEVRALHPEKRGASLLVQAHDSPGGVVWAWCGVVVTCRCRCMMCPYRRSCASRTSMCAAPPVTSVQACSCARLPIRLACPCLGTSPCAVFATYARRCPALCCGTSPL